MESLTLMPALPEIFLAVIGMVLLMFGVFQGDASRHWMTWAVVASLVVAGVLVPQAADGRSLAFGGLFVTDAFAVFMKELALLGAALALALVAAWLPALAAALRDPAEELRER